MAENTETMKAPETGTGTETRPEARTEAPVGSAQHPVAGLRNEIDRAFERFFRDPWGSALSGFPSTDWLPFVRGGSAISPSSEMTESDAGYELCVELPGLDENDIELTVTDDMLTLKGEKREEKTSGEGESHFSERRYGSFRRSFALPRGVKAEEVKARFAKGVLKVTLPKSEEAKSAERKIEVDAA